MAVAEKWVTSAEGLVTPAVGSVFDMIYVAEDAKFRVLTVETGHTDGGLAVANTTEGAARTIAPGLYQGRWTAVHLHSGFIRLYEGR